MSLTIDVAMPRKPGLLPIFEISGEDDVTIGLLRNVRVDIEMPADDEGNPYLRVRLPDRKMLLIKSAPLPGELFFLLEEELSGKPNRPIVELKADDKVEDITDQLGWGLLDFSGAWVHAVRFAAEKKMAEAAAEAAKAVQANPADEGFRVVWGRFLLGAGKTAEARSAFEEELEVFPASYRAMAELAAMDYRDTKREKALELLLAALSVYPNHLKSLLLTADLLLAGGGEEAVPYLARAWRLSGALAPQHIHAIIERRKRNDLLEAVRQAAHEVDLATSVTGEGVAVPKVEDRDTHRAVEESSQVTPPEPAPQPTQEEVEVPVEVVTKKDIIRLAAREVYRDGKVTPEEKLVFRQICRAFPIGSDETMAIVKEEREAVAKKGVSGGDFVAKDLFRDVLKLVYRDGKVSRDEVNMVMGLAKTLGLSRSECVEVQEEVKKA